MTKWVRMKMSRLKFIPARYTALASPTTKLIESYLIGPRLLGVTCNMQNATCNMQQSVATCYKIAPNIKPQMEYYPRTTTYNYTHASKFRKKTELLICS